MPVLGFKQHFKKAIISGEKRQTIRKQWKRPIKPGDTLFLSVGMRTKNYQRLKEAECSSITPVTIRASSVTLDSKDLNAGEIEEFAKLDGFSTSQAFYDFFEENRGLPFDGVVIEW